jgi:hypothetical protein
LKSSEIIFPSSENIKLSIISNPEPKIKIISTSNSIEFQINSNNSENNVIQTILHISNFAFKQCSLNNDLSLQFPILQNSKISKEFLKTFNTSLGYSKTTVEAMMVILSLSSVNSVYFNTLVQLLNLNLLFSMGFILNPPQNGLFAFLQKVFTLTNFENFEIYNYSQKEYAYYLVWSREISIQSANISFLEIIIYVFILIFFIYLDNFYLNGDEVKLNEFTNEMNLRDTKYDSKRKKIFTILRYKISLQKFIEIKKIQIKRINGKKNSSFFKTLNNIFLRIYLNRNAFIFLFYETFCIQFTNLAAKTTKLIFYFGANSQIFFLGILVNGLVITFILYFYSEMKYLEKYLTYYARKKDKRKIERYVCIA